MMASLTDRWGELSKRIVFGGLLAAAALALTLYSQLSFYALILIVALLMYQEWLELTQDSPLLNRFGGLVYVGVPIWSLIVLRDQSIDQVLILFALVWATDIGAYFGGKRFGKLLIAPSISAGKTWEGLGFGIFAAAIIGALACLIADFPLSAYQGILIGCFIALISQAGDLCESLLKRRAGVKDSGTLIPGHGGMLDRVDGMVFAAPCYTLMVTAL